MPASSERYMYFKLQIRQIKCKVNRNFIPQSDFDYKNAAFNLHTFQQLNLPHMVVGYGAENLSELVVTGLMILK